MNIYQKFQLLFHLLNVMITVGTFAYSRVHNNFAWSFFIAIIVGGILYAIYCFVIAPWLKKTLFWTKDQSKPPNLL